MSLLEELSPLNITVVARPFVGEEGIVRVAVIKVGVLGSPELVAKEALNKCAFAVVVFFGVKTSSGVKANDSKPGESSERSFPFSCVICVSCGEIAVPYHND